MKQKLSTQDIQALLACSRSRILGMRVTNIYDVDQKTYLFKLSRTPDKCMLLIESGSRFHTTRYDWPKPDFPSNFTMKCRKHLKGKRITNLIQLGVDRVLDITFGSNDATHHLIVELYDKGNIVLTDQFFNILALLRVRKDDADVRYAVGERYPVENARQAQSITMERLSDALKAAKKGDPLRKHVSRIMDCGPAFIEHSLLEAGFPKNARVGEGCDIEKDLPQLLEALQRAERLLFDKMSRGDVKGYILLKRHSKPHEKKEGEFHSSNPSEVVLYEDVMPFPLKQFENCSFKEFDMFDEAVDAYFSEVENHRLEMKMIQQQRTAHDKIKQARQTHENRIKEYHNAQLEDEYKASLIEMNHDLVNEAIEVIRTMVNNQIDWHEIEELVQEARMRGDKVALSISKLNLKQNSIVLKLSEHETDRTDEWSDEDDGDGDNGNDDSSKDHDSKATFIEISLAETAFGNARRLHDRKKTLRHKEHKATLSTEQALKTVERRAMDRLKKTQINVAITKSRIPLWFEKYNWFI
eukprot:gene3907-6387_t